MTDSAFKTTPPPEPPIQRSRYEVMHVTTVHRAVDSRIHHREGRSLAEAGYRVTILGVAETAETRDGVEIFALPQLRHRISRLVLGSAHVFTLVLRRRPSVVHFHDPELLPVALLLAVLLRRVRFVYDVHEDLPRQLLSKDWISRRIRVQLSRVIHVLEPIIAGRFDLVVTVSPQIADRFHGSRVLILRNLPRLEEFQAEPLRRSTESTSRPSDTISEAAASVHMAYVGVLGRERGALEMVSAVGLCDPELRIRLLLAGTFDDPHLKEELESLDGWNRTTYLGPIQPSCVARVLSTSSAGLVLLHPVQRYMDAYPTKLFEYMAAGLPLLVSSFPAWRQIVEDERCGITADPLDPSGIATSMEWLATHAQEAQAMGAKGRAIVQRSFSWGVEAEKLVAEYDRLLSSRS